MASRLNPYLNLRGRDREAPGLIPGDTVTVGLSGDDVDALRGCWERLSADGTVLLPLEKQMWGDEFGQCTDKFGVPWLVNITSR